MLNIIVAVADNNVIGLNGKMPWHLPAELQYFKRITMGKPIIMGRKTFDSIGRALPGRQNIVVTHNRDWLHPDVNVAHSLEDAIQLVGDSEAFIIGGAALYAASLKFANQIYLTKIDAALEGDTFFSLLPDDMWRVVSTEHRAADEKNSYAVDFTVLAKR